MKSKLYTSLFFLLFILITAARAADFKADVIDKIKLSEKDIPAGYIYGKIPDFARKTLKNNPWLMDRAAIKRLTGLIYPSGDYSRIRALYSTILAKKSKPYNDDIVCYIIVYNDSSSAKNEIRKIREFSDFNKDRVILFIRNNIAVIMFVDNVKTFPLLLDLSKIIENRLNQI